MTKKEIYKAKILKMKDILKEQWLEHVWIFGSIVRGDDKRGSDVDLLYEPNKWLSAFDSIKIKHFMKGKLRKKIDLVDTRFLHPSIKDSILSSKELIY